MTYEYFKKYIAENILLYLPEKYSDAQVDIREVTQNNNVKLDSLTVLLNGNNIAPTIYLNDYYKNINPSSSLELRQTMGTIADMIEKYETTPFPTDKLLNWENIKDRICFQLINVPKNMDYLEKCPHFIEQDLAGTYRIILSQENGVASIRLTNELFNSIQHQNNITISTETLKELAFENTIKMFPLKIQSLTELLFQTLPENDMFDSPFYILTNEDRWQGASTLLYPNTLDKVTEILGVEKYYIIPSSVHECLVLPDIGMSPAEIENMIHDVNTTQVTAEEYLSDNCYIYDSRTKVLDFAGPGRKIFEKQMFDRIAQNCRSAGVQPKPKLIKNIEKLQQNTKQIIDVKQLDRLQKDKIFMQLEENQKLLKSITQDMENLAVIAQR